jgi:hypothetical protein
MLWIDKPEALSVTVSQARLRQPEFQLCGKLADALWANLQTAQALQILHDSLYFEGPLRESHVARLPEPGEQRVCTMVYPIPADPYQPVVSTAVVVARLAVGQGGSGILTYKLAQAGIYFMPV